MVSTTSRERLIDFGIRRRAIKIAEEMKSFNDHLEFTRRIGCPSEVAAQMFRRLQAEGKPPFVDLKCVYPPSVEDSSKLLPMNWRAKNL